jgi:hypothetical protein
MVNFDNNSTGKAVAENPDNQLSAIIKKPANVEVFNQFVRSTVLMVMLLYSVVLFSCLQRILPLDWEYPFLMAQYFVFGLLALVFFRRCLIMCKAALKNDSTWLQELKLTDVLPKDFSIGLVIMLSGVLICLTSLFTTQFNLAFFLILLSLPIAFSGVTAAESVMTKKAWIHTRAYWQLKALLQKRLLKR